MSIFVILAEFVLIVFVGHHAIAIDNDKDP